MKVKKEFFVSAAFLAAGSLTFALGFDLFLLPGNIAMGGFTGIATILHRAFGTPVGTVIILMNIPLALLSIKLFGLKFVSRTLIAITCNSLLIDFFSFLPPMIDDRLLCSLFGGVITGVGMGILFTKGFTTGGSDVVVFMLRLKFKSLSTGLLLFIVDGLVVATAAVVFREAEAVLYSIITIFSSTKVIDTILGLNDRAKLALVVSDRSEEFSGEIARRTGRGITILDGQGWFTRDPKRVLMCVVGRSEAYVLKEIVSSVDPQAFMILSDASEVLGEGFKPGGN